MLTHIRTKGVIIEFMEQTKNWKNLENLLIYGIFEAKTFHTFDRDIRFEKKHSQKFSFFRPVNEKRRKSAGFQDFSKKKFLHGR